MENTDVFKIEDKYLKMSLHEMIKEYFNFFYKACYEVHDFYYEYVIEDYYLHSNKNNSVRNLKK